MASFPFPFQYHLLGLLSIGLKLSWNQHNPSKIIMYKWFNPPIILGYDGFLCNLFDWCYREYYNTFHMEKHTFYSQLQSTSSISMPCLHCLLCIASLWSTKTKQITHIIRTYLYSCYTKPESTFSNVIIINITYIYHRNSESHKNVPFYRLSCHAVTYSSMLLPRHRT